MFAFDDATLRILDEAYLGPDVTRRRRANFDALSPQPGAHVVDMGCGQGNLTLDLARAVGSTGRVSGIDPSDTMLAAAGALCAGRGNVTLQSGTAAATGLPDACADGYVSVQVWEYLDDLPAALAETRRILKPGGRAVIGDMHFGTLSWASEDPDLMARALASWDFHFVSRDLPERLPPLLAAAGFRLDAMIPVPFCATRLRPASLDGMMIVLMTRHMIATGDADPGEAEAWRDAFQRLDAEGRYFFTLTHFVAVATRL